MTNPASGDGSDCNAKIIKEFRANQRRVGGPWADTTLILIHHIGARSGVERVTPLGCFHQPEGRFVIVASSGGSPTHPDWYYNQPQGQPWDHR
jgi:F420H(2)-dependent quinone reductase